MLIVVDINGSKCIDLLQYIFNFLCLVLMESPSSENELQVIVNAKNFYLSCVNTS